MNGSVLKGLAIVGSVALGLLVVLLVLWVARFLLDYDEAHTLELLALVAGLMGAGTVGTRYVRGHEVTEKKETP